VIGFNQITGKLNFTDISPSLNEQFSVYAFAISCCLRLVKIYDVLLYRTPYRTVNEPDFSEYVTPILISINHILFPSQKPNTVQCNNIQSCRDGWLPEKQVLI